MPRSSPSKGQWFLISAVIASGAFLAISFLLRDYFSVQPAYNVESMHLDGVREGAIRAIELDCTNNGGYFKEMTNLTEYIHFATREMASLGYLLNVTPKPKSLIGCSSGTANFYVIILKSSDADVWDGARPEISGIETTFSGGTLSSVKMNLRAAMPYPFSVNASVYSPGGAFVNSVIKYVPNGNSATVSFAGLNIPQSQAGYTVVNSIHLIGKKRWELY